MSNVARQRIVDLVSSPLRNEGYEIADLIVASHGARATVRLFLYCKDGVSLDECARLSKLVGEIIEPTDMFANGYNLEISSPGLERPLRNGTDFRYRIGEKVRIAFRDHSRERVEAKIVGVKENRVCLSSKDGDLTVDISEIDSARILF